MANTWQTNQTTWLPKQFRADVREGVEPALFSSIRRLAERFTLTTNLPGQPSLSVPVEALVGGKRHGIGFLARVTKVNGQALTRPVLVQARYAWSVREGKLVLAPGCPEVRPSNYETAFGLPLSPAYEKRCLECHGEPQTLGAGALGGVQCETCHGPGSRHLVELGKGIAQSGIVNPKRLSADDSIAVCGQCHVGLTKLSDPAPEDLLVANQVVALKSSECYLQSRRGLTCTTCHNPHQDSPNVAEVSVAACLTCHSLDARPHAAICPVNPKGECLGCHMPAQDIGPFHLVDHLIRIHPEQHVQVRAAFARTPSQYQPESEFLEEIKADDSGRMQPPRFLGRKMLADLPAPLRAAVVQLRYGQTSPFIQVGGKSIAVRRMTRDFRWRSDRLTDSAEIRLARGDWQGALAQSQAALGEYPHALRALVTAARALSDGGDFSQATKFLQAANSLYPEDANAAYNLGRVLDKRGNLADAIACYRRAIVNDSELISANSSLGKALVVGGDLPGAVQTFRDGLLANPLSALLHRNLSQVLAQQGDGLASRKALDVALAIETGDTHSQ